MSAPWWNRVHRSGNLITGLDYSDCGNYDGLGFGYRLGATWFCVNVNSRPRPITITATVRPAA